MAAVGGTSETTQMYLRTVLELERAGVVPLRARLRERLGHTAPAISQAVARLTQDGLLELSESDRLLALTPSGRRVAEAVLRKHQLAEYLLTTMAGLSAEQAHAEACDWEHVISDDVEQRLRDRLGRPPECPYTRQQDFVQDPAGTRPVVAGPHSPDVPPDDGRLSSAALSSATTATNDDHGHHG